MAGVSPGEEGERGGGGGHERSEIPAHTERAGAGGRGAPERQGQPPERGRTKGGDRRESPTARPTEGEQPEPPATLRAWGGRRAQLCKPDQDPPPAVAPTPRAEEERGRHRHGAPERPPGTSNRTYHHGRHY